MSVHRDDANLPILCSGIGIAFDCNAVIGEITIGTMDASRFAFWRRYKPGTQQGFRSPC